MEAKSYLGSVFAESTKRTYMSYLRAYLRYCSYFSRKPVPADQATLVGYVAFLARSIIPRSIGAYLNIIRILHVSAGFANPLFNNWEINMLKRAIARVHGSPPQQKLPITIEILLDIRELLNFSDNRDICFWAACLVAFFGFLRKSSLLMKSAKSDPKSGICRFDVTDLSQHSFSLRIRNSKTIQFGQRVLTLPYAACKISELCPVRAVVNHLTSSRLNCDSPLFAYTCGKKVKAITYCTFTSMLKAKLSLAGYNPKLISAHSFRRGGTSFAIASGMDPVVVKARGDWSSNAFERYVYLLDKSTMRAAKRMSKAVVRCSSKHR